MTASQHLSCDLLVVGSGAGGLSAAVTAAWLGLDVIVVEKSEFIGGTTAWSGGWMWVPRNPLAQRANIVEPIETPRNYLRHELTDGYDEAAASWFATDGRRFANEADSYHDVMSALFRATPKGEVAAC